MDIIDTDIYGFINISEKGNIKKILKNFNIKINKKSLKILVEPTNIDYKEIKDYKSNGYTVLLFTNNLKDIKELCNTIYIIKDNKVFLTKTVKQLFKNDYSVITISAKGVKKIPLPLKNMVIKSMTDNKIKFMYNDDINRIINILKDYKVDKLLIEEVQTKDLFSSCKE